MGNLRIGLAALLSGMFLSLAAIAQEAINVDEDGLAVQGYDTVAYFTVGRPVPGSIDHEVELHGVRWWFSEAGNKELFIADPEAYMPRYGGFCSGAMSRGFKWSIDPEAFAIIDGRLYLAHTKSGIGGFEENADSTVAAADANWRELGRED